MISFSGSLFIFCFIFCSIRCLFCLYLDNSYTKRELFLNGGNNYVEGKLTVENLTILPCTNITFKHLTSQILVSSGKVNIYGNQSCPIHASLQNFADTIFQIDSIPFKGNLK